MRADTRRLRALLHLLRAEGVSEYSDGTTSVKFAPPKPTPLTAVRAEDAGPEAPADPEAMHVARLRSLMGGLFNSDGQVG